VGAADDAACACFQQVMVLDVPTTVVRGMAAAIENFRREQQARRFERKVASPASKYVVDEFSFPGHYILQRFFYGQTFGHFLPAGRNYCSWDNSFIDLREKIVLFVCMPRQRVSRAVFEYGNDGNKS
jgi:hypothetical protein